MAETSNFVRRMESSAKKVEAPGKSPGFIRDGNREKEADMGTSVTYKEKCSGKTGGM